MKLAAIREQKAHDKPPPGDGVRQPRSADEAEALFWQGMREMESRDDEVAFEIFDKLSRDEGGAPPQLVATAKAVRDFLDPERTAEQKARAMLDFFSPTLVRVFPDDEAGPADEVFGEPDRPTVMPLDPLTTDRLTRNDLFTAAFRCLEQGDLDEADLERTKGDPS
jgi:hypothetical protein